jgi:hypothetical protein
MSSHPEIFGRSSSQLKDAMREMSPSVLISQSDRSSGLLSPVVLRAETLRLISNPETFWPKAKTENFARVDEKELPELLVKMDMSRKAESVRDDL